MKSLQGLLFFVFASIFVFLIVPRDESQDRDSQSESAVLPEAEVLNSSAASRRQPTVTDGLLGEGGLQRRRESLFASLQQSVSPAARTALENQIEEKFRAFFDAVDADANRREVLSASFLSAYGNIQLLSNAMEQGELSRNDFLSLRSPNYVVDQMSSLLSLEETLRLEEYLRDEARSTFDLATDSQIESTIPDLSEQSRDQLLDTLFRESYALTSADGLAMTAGVLDNLEQQMAALQNTALALAGTLPALEYRLVEQFIAEKEKALAAAAIIFDR